MNKLSAIEKIENEYEIGLSNVQSALHSTNRDRKMNHYIKSYPSLLNTSQSLCKQAYGDAELQEHAIVAIAHMAYGWMPATLTNCDINSDIKHKEGKTILDAIDFNGCNEAKIFVCGYPSSPINNSCTGLSKALHFINPEFFPIWDRYVAKNFGIQGHHYQMNKIENYGLYIEFCHSMLKLQIVTEAVKKVQIYFRKNAKYEVSKIRALEFILFVVGKKSNSLPFASENIPSS